MAFFIQFPDDPDTHGNPGAKASILARLTREGFAVPPWFVVTSEAFTGNLSIDEREAMASAKMPSTLAAAVADLTLSASFLDEVDVAIVRLCPNDEPVVVRPSLAAADMDSFEAASGLSPKIYTSRANAAERIAAIYRAAYSEPVLLQRRRQRLPLFPDPPAILIQRMVSPDVSGAAFGSDLTTGQRSLAVIAAVFGLPTSMANGDCQPDIYRIDRSGKVVRRDIAKKGIAHHPTAEGNAGYIAQELPPSKREATVLRAQEIAKIDRLLSDVERVFECPQEIQWAIEGDTLFLLDANPLTQLDRHIDPDSPTQYLDAGALAELFPGTVLPLTMSIAQRATPHIARAFLRGVGISSARVVELAHPADNLLSIVRARIYANLESWYSLFSTLPDYPYNAHFYGRLAGWTGGLPQQVERGLRRAAMSKSAGLATLLGMYRGFGSMTGRVVKFHKAVSDALNALPDSIERARLDELAGCYRMLEERLLPAWDAPPLNEYYTLIAYGYLTQHVMALWPQDHANALAGLLSRGGGKWLPPSLGKVQEIALTIVQSPQIVDTLRSGGLSEIFAVIAGQPALRARCEEYIAKHGVTTFGGCKLEAAPLSADPLPLFRAIAQAATALSGHDDDAIVRAIPRREDVLAAPGIGPFARRKLNWLTNHARARLRDRDLIAEDIARVVAATRELFTEIGRRYYALGLLESPRDIFYLTLDEALGYIEATIADTDLAGLVSVRRAHYDQLAQLAPPKASLTVHLPVMVGNQIEQKPDTAVSERRGVGVSPGFVRGRVWMAGRAKHAAITGPFVLVAEYAESSWPLLYPGVDGIVIEKGGAFSAAVLGFRDQRIATVVGVPNLTTWLSDGDLVDIDGSTGSVRKVVESASTIADLPAEVIDVKTPTAPSEQSVDMTLAVAADTAEITVQPADTALAEFPPGPAAAEAPNTAGSEVAENLGSAEESSASPTAAAI